MFETDNEIISFAVNMWANHIETGDGTISAADAVNMNRKDKIKYLEPRQQKFVMRLRELAAKNLNIGVERMN